MEVNCAAIPEELIESELFGHIKGSFTGAVEDKVGKFEQAHGGTLFLDEVGDMSLRTQSKVLRVIEEQRFTPVGSGNNLTVDVRVIAATNKNLEEEIQKGNFREDLFYRLNVIPFFVPPLRDHAEDIPALANYFLAEFARAYGRRPKHFSDAAHGSNPQLPLAGQRARIAQPGRAAGHHGARARESSDGTFRLPSHHDHTASGSTRTPTTGFSSLQEARAAYERDYILRKLEENQGNVTPRGRSSGPRAQPPLSKNEVLGNHGWGLGATSGACRRRNVSPSERAEPASRRALIVAGL